MTFLPQHACFGTGVEVVATIMTDHANWGASPDLANSPNTDRETSTQTYVAGQLNILNVDTTVPSNANTT